MNQGYVYRRPFDYRAPRLWIGTKVTAVVASTAKSKTFVF